MWVSVLLHTFQIIFLAVSADYQNEAKCLMRRMWTCRAVSVTGAGVPPDTTTSAKNDSFKLQSDHGAKELQRDQVDDI